VNRPRRMQLCLILAAQFLATACTPMSTPAPNDRVLDLEALKSYRVEDASGSLSLIVKDVLVDDCTGDIDYLMIQAEPTGYGLDPRTAPILAEEYIPVPWMFIHSEPTQGRLRLTVNADVVLNAPRVLQFAWTMSGSALTYVDQYWTSIAEED
jgi:hypothetical protein